MRACGPGTELGESVHIGNFVETKKASLGAGAKANHLAYLGDASVGAGCNIGAGAITCNYDGVDKHRTEIGDGVFVGTNATLVAPLAIDDEAYVGAGSTITSKVGQRGTGRGPRSAAQHPRLDAAGQTQDQRRLGHVRHRRRGRRQRRAWHPSRRSATARVSRLRLRRHCRHGQRQSRRSSGVARWAVSTSWR